MTDPAGQVTTYAYGEFDNLLSVTYPDDAVRHYHYEDTSLPVALTGITDENGDRYATYQYQADGRAIATGHAGGADLHTLTYNPDGSTTVTDPLGTQRTHNFTTILGVVKSAGQSQPGGSGCGPASSATTYDANGNIASRADFNGNKTCYAYDLARNLETARVEGLASGSSCPANPATYVPAANTAERKILTEWHPTFRLPTKVTEAGRETTTVYDTRGNVTSHSVKDTATGKTRTTSTAYTFHASVPGVLVQKIENGPRTDVVDTTTTDYYAPDENCEGGHFGCRGQIKQITNALGHITTYNEYDAHGHVLRMTDPNGLVTAMTYTPRGWLQTRDVGGELSRFDYDGVGQITKHTRPDGSFAQYQYDAAHRLTSITDSLGNKITYTLDAAGNRIKEDITDPAGTLAQTQRREYDALNRLWKDIGTQGQTTRYEYDAQGNRKLVADPLNHATTSQYDPLDRLVRTIDPAGGQTTQTPDALDRIASVTDPKGVATTYTYNGFGEVIREVSADRGTTDYTYNDAGSLTSRKDARGITLGYGRDVLERLTSITSRAGDAIRFEATLAYDKGINALGRLTSVNSNGGGYQRYRYDGLGRLVHKEEGLGGELSHDLVYDPAGRLVQQTLPSGTVVTTGHGNDGRPVEIRVNGAVLISNIVYQPFGAPKAWTWGNGQPYTRSFDADGRLNQHPLGSDTRLITFDAASRITGFTHINPGLNRAYGYDPADRLIHEVDNVGATLWDYDPNGNRLRSQPGSANYAYTYPATGNRLSSVAGPVPRTYTYDAMGNVIGDGTFTYSYSRLGRLASVWQGSLRKAAYGVNALGQRTSKTANGITTLFVYDEAGHLLGEYDGALALIQETVWLDDIPVVVLKKTPQGQIQIYYIHTDHLNTPRAILDSSNRVVWKWNSNAFGQGHPEEDPDGDGAKFEYNPRFPGQYYDKETLRHYNYYRSAYNPGTGRYEEADPIGLAGGINLYLYANAAPTMYTDPLGLLVGGTTFSAGMRGISTNNAVSVGFAPVNGAILDGGCYAKCKAQEAATVGTCGSSGASIGATVGGVLGGLAGLAPGARIGGGIGSLACGEALDFKCEERCKKCDFP